MSSFSSEKEEHENSKQAQRSKGLDNGDNNDGRLELDGTKEASLEIEITASQKMLSAISGSILTSLLGLLILQHSL